MAQVDMMLRYAAVRMLYGAIAFLAVTVILFSFFRANNRMDEWLIPDIEEAWERYDRIRAESGIDDPWVVAYFGHLGNVFQGDFGHSYKWYPRTVAELLTLHLPNSLTLGALAAAVTVLLAVGMGSMSAVKRHSAFDVVGRSLAALAQASPVFWVAILLILVVAFPVGWLPASGKSGIASYVLPAAALALSMAAVLRFMRSAMIDQLESQHAAFARIQGLPQWRVAWRHGVRIAALAPSTTIVAGVSSLIGALLVVEVVFAWPGVGHLVVQAAQPLDQPAFLRSIPVLHGILLITATALIALHVVVDIALAFADPRIRFPEAREYALEATPAAP